MEGFHFTAPGGFVTRDKQVFAELVLPPGMYFIFGKANIAVSSNVGDMPRITRAYEARLEMGSIDDSLIGGLLYNSDDPGSRYESIALNIAGEIRIETNVKLMFSRGLDTRDLIVSEPRLSVIAVTSLQISTEIPVEQKNERFFPNMPVLGLSRRTLLSIVSHDSTTETK
ncbi:MAG: hypothetical protein ABI690_04890 [Chloroflexota bacterium]